MKDGTTLNFGRISRGGIFEQTVDLVNGGTDTLILGNVEASCGCTATMLSENRIPPGRTGNLLIKFNPSGFSGSVYKKIVINSNAPGSPRTTIEFSANVVDEITFAPESYLFKDARPNKAHSLMILVRNESSDTLYLKTFRTKVQGLLLRLPSGPIPPKQSFNLVADFTPKAEIPVIADRVIITTSNVQQPEISIPIYGNVKEFRFEELGRQQ